MFIIINIWQNLILKSLNYWKQRKQELHVKLGGNKPSKSKIILYQYLSSIKTQPSIQILAYCSFVCHFLLSILPFLDGGAVISHFINVFLVTTSSRHCGSLDKILLVMSDTSEKCNMVQHTVNLICFHCLVCLMWSVFCLFSFVCVCVWMMWKERKKRQRYT